jgi:hypothetical protein
MDNCTPGSTASQRVIDRCSNLFIDVFGDSGAVARAAIGMAEPPSDLAVESELVAETSGDRRAVRRPKNRQADIRPSLKSAGSRR